MKLVEHEQILSAGKQNYTLCFSLKGSYEVIRTSEGVNKLRDTDDRLMKLTLNSERHFTLYLKGIIPS